jgi:hypothetical protein
MGDQQDRDRGEKLLQKQSWTIQADTLRDGTDNFKQSAFQGEGLDNRLISNASMHRRRMLRCHIRIRTVFDDGNGIFRIYETQH